MSGLTVKGKYYCQQPRLQTKNILWSRIGSLVKGNSCFSDSSYDNLFKRILTLAQPIKHRLHALLWAIHNVLIQNQIVDQSVFFQTHFIFTIFNKS